MAEDSDVADILGVTTHVPVDLVPHITLAYVRYQRSQSLGDLDDLLGLWRAILEFTETDGVLTPAKADNLARHALQAISSGLQDRTKLAGDAADLDEHIDVLRRLSDFPDSQTPIAPLLGTMGWLLRQRYDLQRNAEDLDSSIVAFRRAFDLDPDQPLWVRSLIKGLKARSEAFSRSDDSDEIIALTNLTLEDRSDAFKDRDDFTAAQEQQYFDRLSHSRDASDLDTFLAMSRELSPAGILPQSGVYRARALARRFEHSGEPWDLDLAIKYHVSLLDRDLSRADRLTVLSDLSEAYAMRFASSDSHGVKLKSDIDNAIACAMQAMDILDTDDPEYRKRVRDLARFRTVRGRTGWVESDLDNASRIEDIDTAAELYRAVERPEEIDVSWSMGYGVCLYHRGRMLCDSDAARECIAVLDECARRIPASNDVRYSILYFLAESRSLAFTLHIRQCNRNGTPYDDFHLRAKEVMLAFVDAANATDGIADWQKLQIAEAFTELSALYAYLISSLDIAAPVDLMDPSAVKDILSRFIAGMSEAMGLGHTLSRRYQRAAMLQSTVLAAVANMLMFGDNHTALEWFEQGRAVVWSQILSLRTPLDELREVHPDLAEKLAQLSLELENAGRRAPPPSQAPSDIFALGDSSLSMSEAESVAGRQLAREHRELLQLIRSNDGFQDFLHPKRANALVKAAETRAVVCINVHTARCDALIIFGSDVHVVRLPELKPEKIEEWHSKLTRFLQWKRARALDDHRKSKAVHHPQRMHSIRDVLRELWYCVVKPILGAYQYNLNGRLAHITWCTAGKLTFLPLHAAGPYDGSPNAFDLVVSSYAPNLSSLLPRETVLESTTSQSTTSPSILVVAQPQTPGVSPLPGTVSESEKVAKRFKDFNSNAEVLLGEHGTTNAVLAHMAKHPYVHLACHGKQDTDPTKSAFILHDGDLSLHTLMAHKSSNAQLAFLSACETATGDETVPNEAVHLAGGMLAAGYKNVVATMWSIGDTEAPRVADEFYKALLADPEHNVAYALHEAVKKLREHVGVNDFVKWMPFIHFG